MISRWDFFLCGLSNNGQKSEVYVSRENRLLFNKTNIIKLQKVANICTLMRMRIYNEQFILN